MKKCFNCGNYEKNNFIYCTNCGTKITPKTHGNKNFSKPNLFVILSMFIVLVLLFTTILQQIKIDGTKSEVGSYKQEKALQDYINTPTISNLKIQNWTQTNDGNYGYINGTVTNTSKTITISYYEIEVVFYDLFGKVIDSDWTNESRDLEPGETRSFEIMYERAKGVEKTKVMVKEVS